MQIPKAALLGLGILGALFLGWMLRATTADGASPVAAATAPLSAVLPADDPQSDVGLPDPPIYITIVTPGPADPADPTAEGSSVQAPRRAPGNATAAPAPAHASAPSPVRAANTSMATPAPAVSPSEVQAPLQVAGLSVVANGDRIVIANDGSIVLVGDNGELRGNTGNAGASGAIAVDVNDSELTSGNSGLSAPSATRQSAGSTTSARGAPSPTVQLPLTATEVGALDAPQVLSSGSGAPASRAIGIAGYEDHSLEVAGNDNLLTYDDSNLFYHRIGTFNGNTGDTDTSGLNVVDAAGSRVRSGDSGNSDETPDPPPFDPAKLASSPAGVLSTPTAGGAAVSVADINGISTATGADSLVIGGDGMDDNGVRVRGDRNVATYDDGNVAVGGIGNVNAQIGDSDTSGAVVMAVRDSDIEAGGSFLPASQQAGAEVSDPFDGDDPDVSPPMT